MQRPATKHSSRAHSCRPAAPGAKHSRLCTSPFVQQSIKAPSEEVRRLIALAADDRLKAQLPVHLTCWCVLGLCCAILFDGENIFLICEYSKFDGCVDAFTGEWWESHTLRNPSLPFLGVGLLTPLVQQCFERICVSSGFMGGFLPTGPFLRF